MISQSFTSNLLGRRTKLHRRQTRLCVEDLRNGFDLAAIKIDKGKLFVELHFQFVHDTRDQNGGLLRSRL
jgi:hypothetical protein